jgi:hypothetical protein
VQWGRRRWWSRWGRAESDYFDGDSDGYVGDAPEYGDALGHLHAIGVSQDGRFDWVPRR